jgi:hypothetical protein
METLARGKLSDVTSSCKLLLSNDVISLILAGLALFKLWALYGKLTLPMKFNS